MREFDLLELPNGIRVIHKQVYNTAISHCGYILDIGSRDELPHQEGLAHFWEHMAFKGTEKRKSFHILTRLDSVGGELNAYTTKEKICFHASVLNKHFEKAAELLTDITFNSVFPEKEIKKEKGVILEEMSMYLDDPSDAIQDEFDEVIFSGHQLGKNILGTQESVGRFSQPDFRTFVDENLNTERLVFSSVSSMPSAKVFAYMEKCLKDVPKKSGGKTRPKFEGYKSLIRTEKKAITQAHCIMGTEAFSSLEPKRLPFFLLANLLGGPAMNSRLNLAIREKYGFVYSIDASFHSYIDTGSFGIQFATEEKTLDKCVSLVFKELEKLKNSKLGTLQLHNAKEQLMGQLAMAEESNMGLMLLMGKSVLDIGQVESMEYIFSKIKAIGAEELMDLSNEVFADHKTSILTYMPTADEDDD